MRFRVYSAKQVYIRGLMPNKHSRGAAAKAELRQSKGGYPGAAAGRQRERTGDRDGPTDRIKMERRAAGGASEEMRMQRYRGAPTGDSLREMQDPETQGALNLHT